MLRTPIAPSTEVPTAPTPSLDPHSCVAAAGPTDLEPLINVIVLAFAADPVARWMYPDPERYLAYFGRFIRAFASKAFSTG